MTKIVLGYLLSFLYMLTVIVVGEVVQKKFNTDKEITRKMEHIATSASWVICYVFVGATYHLIIVNFLALVGLAFLTFSGVMKSVEREDTAKSYGLLYFGISTFVNITVAIFLTPDLVPMTAVAYYCLTLADGFAPIIAKAAGKYNIKLFEPKTLAGFIAVFVISSLVTFVCSQIFGLLYSPLFIISVGSLAAHAEIYGKRGLDNLSLPFAIFGYLLLNYYGFVPVSMQIALIILPLFTILAAVTHALTFFGGLISFCYITLCAFFGPISITAMIFILFFIEAVVSKTSKMALKKQSDINTEHHGRDGFQILVNTIVALASITIYYITNSNIFLIASAVVIAEEFADSIASGVGRLAKNAPIDIIKWKRIEPGISGGVTLLGLSSALIASFAAMGILFLFGDINPIAYLIAGAVSFLGTIIDSIIGSLFQALYCCPICSTLTESPTHCQTTTDKLKGIAIINNSAVNLISGALTAVIIIFILLLT